VNHSIKTFLGSLLLLSVLSACGGGGGGTDTDDNGNTGTPTDPGTDFALIPSDYLTDYQASIGISGEDNKGNTYSGIFTERTGGTVTFLGETATEVLTNVTFQGSQGAYAIADSTSYFSADRRLLGQTSDGGIETVSATGVTALPVTARIGDSGQLGVYTDNQGDEVTTTWKLDDGYDGRAWVVFESKNFDGLGDVESETVFSFLVQPDGTRLKMKMESYNRTVDLRISMGGDY